MKPWTLSLRLLARQRRSGAVWTLVAGLAIATGALAAVSLFTDRVGRALERQAGELLAADAIVEDRAPIPEALGEHARSAGLATSVQVELRSVVYGPDDSALFEIKGVDAAYPLRGELRLQTDAAAGATAAAGPPERGTAWLGERGLRALDVEVGDVVEVGTLRLRIAAVLAWEPDRAGGPFQLSPRLMMHRDDLLAAGLIGPGSRVEYRLGVAGPEAAVEAFVERARAGLSGRQRLRTAEQADDRSGRALEQARRFLAVAALTAVMLAAVAVLLASIRYARAQRDLVALLKVFGARGGQVLATMILVLAWLVTIGVATGSLLGYAGQHFIALALSDGTSTLPPARPLPLADSALFTALLAAGFALPPLAGLRRVPPMRILNRSLDPGRTWRGGAWALPVVAAFALPVVELSEPRLALLILGSSAALAAVLAIAAVVLVRGSRALASRMSGAWRFGLSGPGRRAGLSVAQVTALGLGLMALLLLVVVRTELIGQWRASLPEDTPNHFLVNIQPDEAERVAQRLREIGAGQLQVRPMANANLVSVAGDTPRENEFTGQVNLSWAETLPPANEVTAGRFWEPGGTGQLSVARRWAERVGVELGDRLEFDAGGRRFSAEITSIRDVDWGSFNVNFFLLLTPEAAEALPHQFIASFHLPADAEPALDELARTLPAVSLLDVGALIDRVFVIISRVSQAAQVVFLFTLAAGLVVLVAALEATRDQRRGEAALLRALGADRRFVRTGLLIEYSLIGVLAAALAVAGAAVVGALLAREMFDFAYAPGSMLFVAGFAVSLVLVVTAGWLGNRSTLRMPPMRILRGHS